MKKLLPVLVIIMLFFPVFSVNAVADDGALVLAAVKGSIVTDSGLVFEGEYIGIASLSENFIFATEKDSEAELISNGTVISIMESARIGVNNSEIKLLEGVIAVKTDEMPFTLKTGTETALIAANSSVTVQVDDYGNAFNYVVNGSVTLTADLDGNSITLSTGEYIAVSVHKGIRVLENYTESKYNKLKARYIDKINTDDYNLVQLDGKLSVTECTFSEDGILASLKTNGMYLFKYVAENPVSEVLFLDCPIDDASLVIYNNELELIAESKKKSGTIKPNVHIECEPGAVFYAVIKSQNDTEYKLYSERYISVFERSFGVLKSLLVPGLIAAVIFVFWFVVKQKLSTEKKPRF